MSDAPPKAGDPQPRVLLVDDEWLMVEVMTAVLRKLSFTDIDVAADGAAALAMLQQKDYGLVVSDLTMQPMTGLELLHAVRRNPSLRDLPFILTTTAANGQHAAAAKRLGVDGFLLKPFTPAQLADKIAAVRRRPSRPPAGRDEDAGRGEAEGG
jgi:two-component system chemotaxis response regulator CheY